MATKARKANPAPENREPTTPEERVQAFADALEPAVLDGGGKPYAKLLAGLVDVEWDASEARLDALLDLERRSNRSTVLVRVMIGAVIHARIEAGQERSAVLRHVIERTGRDLRAVQLWWWGYRVVAGHEREVPLPYLVEHAERGWGKWIEAVRAHGRTEPAGPTPTDLTTRWEARLRDLAETLEEDAKEKPEVVATASPLVVGLLGACLKLSQGADRDAIVERVRKLL